MPMAHHEENRDYRGRQKAREDIKDVDQKQDNFKRPFLSKGS